MVKLWRRREEESPVTTKGMLGVLVQNHLMMRNLRSRGTLLMLNVALIITSFGELNSEVVCGDDGVVMVVW